MNLIIVESPTKASTISRFLGSDFLVKSSFGHVRDLPKSKMGIDIENSFEPKYVIPIKAKKVIAELKEAATKSDEIIYATDSDREGESIAWHLTKTLKQDSEKAKRIVFHEITKSAIQKALQNPRQIDMNLVDAQQARRVLDRLVGYELSPFLWRKIRYGLSAGRVQSVAVRLVVDREREIQNFVKEEYWTIEADLAKNSSDAANHFRARLIKTNDRSLGKLDIKNEPEAKKIVNDLNRAKYEVGEIVKKEITRNPAPPFTTSTLQQEAARKFGMSAKQTMMFAQRLYETGYITYMRTDSFNLAQSALAQAQEIIKKHFGKEYAPAQPRYYVNKSKGAQEAHEAIRPTDLSRLPEMLKSELDRSQIKLYDIIWKRTIASQMESAIFDQTTVDIKAGRPAAEVDRPRADIFSDICVTGSLSLVPRPDADVESAIGAKSQMRLGGAAVKDQRNIGSGTIGAGTAHAVFRATGQVIKFDGFIKAYTEDQDENAQDQTETRTGLLPTLSVGEILKLIQLLPLQHFTEPTARYTDATLIKALEAHGVGRPSTYAPTLATIQDRDYVEKIEKKYHPTETGLLVNDMLVENFPEIVDINFTSHIEEELDDIAEGKIKWVPVIEEFYTPFKKHLEEKEVSVEKLTEQTEIPCPKCGKKMVIKYGRMGKFLACPDPECKTTKPLPEEEAKIKELEEKTKEERCPICGKPMLVKRGRFGYFLGCSDYPQCKGIAKILNKTGFKCPRCTTGDIVEKKSRGRGKIFYACSRYPDCTFVMNKKPENESDLPEALRQWREKSHDKKNTLKK